MRLFLIAMALLGGGLPLYFFVLYFTQTPSPVAGMVPSLFANPLMGGFTVDILLSISLFLVWTFVEFRRDLKKWLVLLLASCFVGLSFSLPIYFLMKLDESGR